MIASTAELAVVFLWEYQVIPPSTASISLKSFAILTPRGHFEITFVADPWACGN